MQQRHTCAIPLHSHKPFPQVKCPNWHDRCFNALKASERLAPKLTKKLPQPALFGENILQGNFDINRELVSPAIAQKADIKDIWRLKFVAVNINNDVDSAF